MDDFWERLKDSIKERDLTHEGVARTLKIPIGTWKNWLLRKTYPDAKEAVEIAKLLDTSVEYLVDGADESSIDAFADGDERRLVVNYRQLSRYDKGLLMLIVEAWLRKYNAR